MVERCNEQFTRIDDYEIILRRLYNNPNGYENKYTLYERSTFVSDLMREVDISSMSGEEVVELVLRTPLYIKEQESK